MSARFVRLQLNSVILQLDCTSVVSIAEIHGESERVVRMYLLSGTAVSARHYQLRSQLLQGSSLLCVFHNNFQIVNRITVDSMREEYITIKNN